MARWWACPKCLQRHFATVSELRAGGKDPVCPRCLIFGERVVVTTKRGIPPEVDLRDNLPKVKQPPKCVKRGRIYNNGRRIM